MSYITLHADDGEVSTTFTSSPDHIKELKARIIKLETLLKVLRKNTLRELDAERLDDLNHAGKMLLEDILFSTSPEELKTEISSPTTRSPRRQHQRG
jgi:hypothetical protein